MATVSLGRAQGPRMLENTGASPPLMWACGQRPAAQAELGWWRIPQVGVFQVGVPAPDVDQAPRADVVDFTRSLANDCWRKQLGIGREKIQHTEKSSQPRPDKRELPRRAWVGRAVRQAGAQGSLGTLVPPSQASVFSSEKWKYDLCHWLV